MATPNIVVFDTETTGLSSEEDRLVELAGVSLGRPTEIEFTTLVNPERDIPAEARAIHHIGPQDVIGAPSESEAFDTFLGTFPSAGPDSLLVLAAHNAKFDRGFVERIAPRLSPFYVCTYKCAMMTWPDAPRHTNQVLRYYLGLEIDVPEGLFPHRALYDCIVTRAILAELLKIHPLKQLIQWSNGPILLPRVPFGKHAGKTWDQVDYGYLKWATGASGPADNEDFIHTAHHWMRRR